MRSPPGSSILKQVAFQSLRRSLQELGSLRLLARLCTSVCQAKETQGDGGTPQHGRAEAAGAHGPGGEAWHHSLPTNSDPRQVTCPLITCELGKDGTQPHHSSGWCPANRENLKVSNVRLLKVTLIGNNNNVPWHLSSALWFTKLPGFKSQLRHLLAVSPWVSDSVPQFPKMG